MKAENTTKIQFDSLSINEAYARSVVAAFLARYDPTVPQLADLKTAVSEAVTNCIVHAYPDRIGPVTLCVAVYPEREVHITVTDKGVGIPDVPQPWSRCSPLETRRNAPGWALRDAEFHGPGQSHLTAGQGHQGGADQAAVCPRVYIKRKADKAYGIGQDPAGSIHHTESGAGACLRRAVPRTGHRIR